jgi:DNA-binding response OmpR family regulator
MVRIVILGEQTETLSMLADALRQAGYQVRVLSTFKWKMSVLKYLSPHFVIVDAENPHFATAKVCSKIRRDHSLVRVRILVLNPSHRPEENRSEQAPFPADIYVDRPFDPNSVVSCVRGLLKTEPAERIYRKISIDTLVIDPSSYQVVRRGEAVSLGYIEFRLLHYLASHPNTIRSRDELLRMVWKYRNVSHRILDTTIWKLRKKIELCPDKPEFIRSAKGEGYSFHVPSD